MSVIEQVLLKLETPYAGHPYYVSGNAILHAIASTGSGMPVEDQRQMSVSHGVFVPSPYGIYPDWHSQSGGQPWFGSTLKPVEAYQDLFLFRRPHQPWIHDGRPREALNTHGLLKSREGYQFAPSTRLQRGPTPDDGSGAKHLDYNWYLHFYIESPHLFGNGMFDNLQLGGSRNYGYGETSLKDRQQVDLRELDYSWIEDADSHVLELVTPYVLTSEYPQADDSPIPGWWDRSLDYRTRQEAIVEQRQRRELTVVDHGQVTRYEGDRPVETAKNGVRRIGTHSKYGFGELMVRPADG